MVRQEGPIKGREHNNKMITYLSNSTPLVDCSIFAIVQSKNSFHRTPLLKLNQIERTQRCQ